MTEAGGAGWTGRMGEIQGSYDDLFTAVPNALAAMLSAG